MKIEPVRGMHDYYDVEADKIRLLESIFIDTVKAAGYIEAMTPIVEPFELFSIKEGEEIRKTMYTFLDKANRELALRPEITPSIVRLYINSLQHLPKPIRIYYVGTVYRYDEPQYGRYREFRQAGIELLGSNSILADIEVLSLIYTFYEKLNVVNEISVDINDIGVYREIFTKIGIDENKQEHMLHLIDKKEIDDAIKELRSLGINEEAISLIQETINTKLNAVEEISKFIQDFKNSDYKEIILKHLYKLNQIYNIFKNIGYNIRIDLGLVRGLAYYTGFVFEIKHPNVNFSIGGGGRYDKLVELYGGSPTPAVGFALGIERNLIALRDKIKLTYKPKVAVILLDDNVTTYALNVVSELRKAGIEAVFNLKDVSLAKLLPYLPNEGYKLAIIIGKQEANSNNITLRDLIRRTQVTIEKDKAIDIVRQLL